MTLRVKRQMKESAEHDTNFCHSRFSPVRRHGEKSGIHLTVSPITVNGFVLLNFTFYIIGFVSILILVFKYIYDVYGRVFCRDLGVNL